MITSGIFGQIAGVRIIEDRHCYAQYYKVRGIPSKIKPNRYRPLYRNTLITEPRAYMVKGLGIVCHPSIAYKIKETVRSYDSFMVGQ